MPRSLSASSENYYITTTSSSQIKVWKIDTVSHTKNTFGSLLTELCEPNHLNLTYTCICILDHVQFGELPTTNKQIHSWLVLGDQTGRIVIFDILKSCKIFEISNNTKDESKTFKHIQCQRYSRINSISFNEDSNELIICSSDKKMRRICIETDNNKKNIRILDELCLGEIVPSCLTITHPFINKKKNNQYLIVGCNNIDIYNITNNNKQQKNQLKQQQKYRIGSLQGHASQVRHLHLTDDNNYLISAAQDRYIYIWKCKSFWKSSKKQLLKKDSKKAAMYALPLNDDIIAIDIQTLSIALTKQEMELQKKQKKNHQKSHKNVYYIAAASKSSIYIWCFDPLQISNQKMIKNGTKTTIQKNTLKPVVQINVKTPKNGTKHSVVNEGQSYSWIKHIQFMDEQRLMVLRGTASIAIVKQVQYCVIKDDNDGKTAFIPKISLENVSLDSLDKDILSEFEAAKIQGNAFETERIGKIDEHLTVLDCGDSSLPSIKTTDSYMNINGNGNGKNKRKRESDSSDEEPPTKKVKTNTITNGTIKKKKNGMNHSLTFAEKLYEIEKKTEENKNDNHLMNIPTADSLAALLTQSLQANDQTMFENLLSMQDDEAMQDFEGDMIKKTLDRIPSSLAVQLLEKLTLKFRVSPRQSMWILRWLWPLLNSHSASFAKNLNSRKHLISIHQAIDYQVKSLLPAMKLQGRLSLLMSQMQKVNDFNRNDNNNNNRNNEAYETARYQPLFVHDESLEEDTNNNNNSDINKNNKNSSDNMNPNNTDYIEL